MYNISKLIFVVLFLIVIVSCGKDGGSNSTSSNKDKKVRLFTNWESLDSKGDLRKVDLTKAIVQQGSSVKISLNSLVCSGSFYLDGSETSGDITALTLTPERFPAGKYSSEEAEKECNAIRLYFLFTNYTLSDSGLKICDVKKENCLDFK